MNLTKFHKFFYDIPDKSWCVGKHTDANGSRCAMAHCGSAKRTVATNDQSKSLMRLFKKYGKLTPQQVNDGLKGSQYYGKHPKERILNYITELKEKAKVINGLSFKGVIEEMELRQKIQDEIGIYKRK